MEVDHLVRTLAVLLQLSGGGCLIWMGLGPALSLPRIGEFLLLANLSALGVITLWSAAIAHQAALSAGLTLFVLLLALLHKVGRDMKRGPHFMDEPGVSGEVAAAG